MSTSTTDPIKKFEFKFSDESSKGKLTIDYSSSDDELLQFGKENDEVFLFANRTGCLALAKILLKLALGEYKAGYHLHLGPDFSASGLCIGLLAEEAEGVEKLNGRAQGD